jgi:hypothetical protein
MAVHYKTGEPPQERRCSEVLNMCIYDKYGLVRMNEQVHEIDVAIGQAKGKIEASFEDFLPR